MRKIFCENKFGRHQTIANSRTIFHTIQGQTVHFVNCKRIPLQAKIRFLADSATLLFFFDFLCCFGFRGRIAKTLYCSKALQKQANLRNSQQNVSNREPVCGVHGRILIYMFSKLKLSRNPQL